MTLLQKLPNILSFARIILTVIFLTVIFLSYEWSYLLALFIFFLASLTDYWDGKIARWQKTSSDFGAFLDPLADKILIIGTFIAFVELNLVPGWMLLVILLREFIITGLRIISANSGRSIPASRIAKHKTLSQMLSVYLILVYLCIKGYSLTRIADVYFQAFIFFFLLITMFLTLFSGIEYLYHNRDVFSRR